jgi:hypothetical protein
MNVVMIVGIEASDFQLALFLEALWKGNSVVRAP